MSLVAIAVPGLAQTDVTGPAVADASPGLVQTSVTGRAELVERGQDFALYRSVVVEADAAGKPRFRTNEFTLLENALHYLDTDGKWQTSEDLIESTPEGAVAQRGPNTGVFNKKLNVESVFDLKTPAGDHLRGGVRAIQLTDLATGKSQVIATVKDAAAGELVPPNQIVWRDAFDGLTCDVLLIWKHNSFSQDVIFREKPKLPDGWDPASVRLDVLTEILADAPPKVNEQVVKTGDGRELTDHVVIEFGGLSMIMGKALALENGRAVALGDLDSTDQSVPVLKQWRQLDDGRTFLIESLGWKDIEPQFKDLQERAQLSPRPDKATAMARTWPRRPAPAIKREPILMASLPYQPRGYLLDFVIISNQGTPTTFASGVTYYIKTSYYSGSAVTFQPGCVIKYKNNANMLLYGTVSFPQSGQTMPVFTSRNDNNFGEVIQGVSGETDSNGDPTLHKAAQAKLKTSSHGR